MKLVPTKSIRRKKNVKNKVTKLVVSKCVIIFPATKLTTKFAAKAEGPVGSSRLTNISKILDKIKGPARQLPSGSFEEKELIQIYLSPVVFVVVTLGGHHDFFVAPVT